MWSSVTAYPQLEIFWQATAPWPTTPAGLLIAKYTPGRSAIAAIRAITATNDSTIMAPYPIIRASRSRVSILGVVPDEIRAWKPEIAPHATVINANGKTLPPNTGPFPFVNWV